MSRRAPFLLIAALLTVPIEGGAPSSQFDASIAPYLSWRLHRPQNRIAGKGATLRFAYDWHGAYLDLAAEGRYRYDAVDNNPHSAHSLPAERLYRSDFDWRELFFTWRRDDWSLAAGMQQVVWGKADNLRILDRVNPVDLRDFVVPDLSEYRKATPLVRLTAYLGGWETELVYLPFFDATDFAAAGSEFYIPVRERLEAAGFSVVPTREPSDTFDNAELGLRISRVFGKWDVTFVVLSARVDEPVYAGVPTQVPTVRAEYPRQLLLGGGLATPGPGGTVLRAEAAVIPDAPYAAADGIGIERAATLQAMMGVDYSYKDWFFSAQAMDHLIDSWSPAFGVAEHQPLLTFSAEGSHFDAKLRSEAK